MNHLRLYASRRESQLLKVPPFAPKELRNVEKAPPMPWREIVGASLAPLVAEIDESMLRFRALCNTVNTRVNLPEGTQPNPALPA